MTSGERNGGCPNVVNAHMQDGAASATSGATHPADGFLDGDVAQPRENGPDGNRVAVAAAAPDGNVVLLDGREAGRHFGAGAGG